MYHTPVSTNPLVIKDSLSFVQELLNSDINSDSVVMASFDVTSLFTNIPVGETIEIISNQIFAIRVVFEGLDRSQFIKLLSLAVRNCHFTFNNRIYQQIDGVAMGSPLGPLFLDLPLFLDYRNRQHPNICRCCSASYVGQTTRHLHTRISEHLGISPTGKPSSSPVMSNIFSHLNSTGHSANFDDFEILSSCSDTCELLILESLLISKPKPSLNVQGSSIPLNLL